MNGTAGKVHYRTDCGVMIMESVAGKEFCSVSIFQKASTPESLRAAAKVLLELAEELEGEWKPPVGSCPQCFTLDQHMIDTCAAREDCPVKHLRAK